LIVFLHYSAMPLIILLYILMSVIFKKESEPVLAE